MEATAKLILLKASTGVFSNRRSSVNTTELGEHVDYLGNSGLLRMENTRPQCELIWKCVSSKTGSGKASSHAHVRTSPSSCIMQLGICFPCSLSPEGHCMACGSTQMLILDYARKRMQCYYSSQANKGLKTWMRTIKVMHLLVYLQYERKTEMEF